MDHWKQISVRFESKYNNFHTGNCVWILACKMAAILLQPLCVKTTKYIQCIPGVIHTGHALSCFIVVDIGRFYVCVFIATCTGVIKLSTSNNMMNGLHKYQGYIYVMTLNCMLTHCPLGDLNVILKM